MPVLLAIAATAICASGLAAGRAPATARVDMPLVFEPNEGQAPADVRFLARSGRMMLAMHDGGARVTLRSGADGHAGTVELKLGGAESRVPEGVDRLPGVSNYFIGRTGWQSRIAHYGQVRYRDVYPGVDWVYYGKDGEIEYDFVVQPGADPSKVRLHVTGARLALNAAGDLEMHLGDGTIVQRAPVAYQQTPAGRMPVRAAYRVTGRGEVCFRIGAYDRGLPLVIDPVLTYARYVGGNVTDIGNAVAVDAGGNAWIAGQTTSTAQLATAGAAQTSYGGGLIDAFVAKISPTGAILFATYYGGSGGDFASGIAIDSTGAAFVTGATASANLPTINAFRTAPAGSADSFLIRVHGTTGALLQSTYVGGNQTDVASGVATDGTSAYIVGGTNSTDWPAGAVLGALAGDMDAFVAKVTGSTLNWIRLIGGADYDNANAIAIRGNNVWIAGRTASGTMAVLQPAASAGGGSDAFAVLLNLSGDVVRGVRLGGSGIDGALAVAVDAAGNAWVGGDTTSTNFPVQNAWISALQGGQDGFLTSVTPAGAVTYSSYVGGTASDSVVGVAIDPVSGTVYIGGTTASAGWTFTHALTARGGIDAFVVALRPATNSVQYSTAFGGTADDYAYGIAADAAGGVYLTGYTTSSGITGMAGTLNGGQDAFIVRIHEAQTAQALRFVAVTPCRIADTREAAGPFGGPGMAGGSSRSFAVPSSGCGIPANAAAYSLNVTVVPLEPLGYLTLWPTGNSQPLVSTLNSLDGRVKANAAIVPAGANGAVSVFVTNTSHVVLDINGYFVASNAPDTLVFYPVTPCRLSDTRTNFGIAGGGLMTGGSSRSLAVRSGPCGIPASARAYSINVTVVPSGPLGYLTLSPTGVPRPVVSTLNAHLGEVTANAAIVPAGTNGAVDLFVTNDTHVVMDINGYFAPPAAADGLHFYALNPCRVADTRVPGMGAPTMAASTERSFSPPLSACSVPGTAKAYSLNATAVPHGPLGFLTLWPTGAARPLVSTLNSWDGHIVANAALVPTIDGSINAFVTDTADLVLDINGYFAQ